MLAVTLRPQLERAASNDLACPVWKTGAHPSPSQSLPRLRGRVGWELAES
jgi:hypothetical protein